MVEPIGSKPPIHGHRTDEGNLRKTAKELATATQEFTYNVRQVLSNPGLIDHEDFLKTLSINIKSMDAPSLEARQLPGD